MSVRRDADERGTQRGLPVGADKVAWQALREARLRGLAAAEEYRVIADRLYRAGFRDLPSGLLLEWIEATVAVRYEELLALRALGERLHGAIAAGDMAQAAWQLASELDDEARRRLTSGLDRMNRLDHDGRDDGMETGAAT